LLKVKDGPIQKISRRADLYNLEMFNAKRAFKSDGSLARLEEDN
jgi:hypothetical protein